MVVNLYAHSNLRCNICAHSSMHDYVPDGQVQRPFDSETDSQASFWVSGECWLRRCLIDHVYIASMIGQATFNPTLAGI
jgi:hypothetical protein